ncbi:MAG: co-chaperone GroES family protein [Fibrobacteraceae bacterium]|nr:co-chaperone GroES family protein [Fibrobacteraceae bacterium]
MDKNIKNIVVIGDRVLLKPIAESNVTGGGLYLPPSVKESHAVHTGIVVKTGPGYPIPAPQEPDQFLREVSESQNYVPLQVQEGDHALYLHNAGHEIEINHERYVIIPQHAILLVFREDFSDISF